MFSRRAKNPFDQVNPLRRPFVRNIGLTIIFSFLAVLIRNMKPDGPSFSLYLQLMSASVFINALFIKLVEKHKRADLFYILASIGGILCLPSLFIAAIGMIDLTGTPLLVFWCAMIASAVVLVYIYYRSLNDEWFSRHSVSQGDNRIYWEIDFELSDDLKHGNDNPIGKLIQNILLPFAPAIGMTLSRNLQGEQEWLIMGLLALFLALNSNTLYLKYFAVGLRQFLWARRLGAKIIRYSK